MALGDVNNNNNKEYYRDTVYSNNSFINVDSSVEKTSFNISYWKNLMKLSISPLIPSNDDSIKFDYKAESAIYLSPALAYQFEKQIRDFMENQDKYENKGVTTKSGAVVKICKGSKYGTSGICLVIEKINEDKQVEGGRLYEFKKKDHYGINNFNEDDFSFGRDFFENLEIDFLLNNLNAFWTHSGGAQAYYNMDYNRFNHARITGKLTAVAEKLGVESKGKNNKSYGNYSNPFASGGNSSSNDDGGYSYEDIESQLDD